MNSEQSIPPHHTIRKTGGGGAGWGGDKRSAAPVAHTQMEDGWFKKREIWNFLSFSIIGLVCSEICFFHLIIENSYPPMSAYTNATLWLKPNSFNYSFVDQHTGYPTYFAITSSCYAKYSCLQSEKVTPVKIA